MLLVFSYDARKRDLNEAERGRLSIMASVLAPSLASSLASHRPGGTAAPLAGLRAAAPDVRATILDASGRVVGGEPAGGSGALAAAATLNRLEGGGFRILEGAAPGRLRGAIALRDPRGRAVGTLVLETARPDLAPALRRYALHIVGLTWVILFFVVAATLVFSEPVILRPLRRLMEAAEGVARGQWDQVVTVGGSDEFAVLGRVFNQMTQTLIRRVRETTAALTRAASDLASVAVQQASGAAQQATSVQELTATSEEMAAAARQIGAHAGSVADLARRTLGLSQAAEKDAGGAVASVERLRTKLNAMRRDMSSLEEQSEEIGKVLEIVESISDKTDVLALNAVVEAVGAGESGRRFGAIANEVRRLAERTQEFTREVRNSVQKVRESAQQTVEDFEAQDAAFEEVRTGVLHLQAVFQEVRTGADQVAGAAAEIHVASEQQSAAMSQAVTAVAEIGRGAEEVTSGARGIEGSTRALKSLVLDLGRLTVKQSASP